MGQSIGLAVSSRRQGPEPVVTGPDLPLSGLGVANQDDGHAGQSDVGIRLAIYRALTCDFSLLTTHRPGFS